MSTSKTALARWIPLVNFDQRPPIPGGFVLQLSHKLTPSDIMDGLCQRVVLHHILDLKTLDATVIPTCALRNNSPMRYDARLPMWDLYQ